MLPPRYVRHAAVYGGEKFLVSGLFCARRLRARRAAIDGVHMEFHLVQGGVLSTREAGGGHEYKGGVGHHVPRHLFPALCDSVF